MSPRDQRIAIARALGHDWKMYNGRPVLFGPECWAKYTDWVRHVPTAAEMADEYNVEIGIASVPHYLDDLHAMRDAEHWLEYSAMQWHGDESATSAPEAYMSHLKDIVGDDDWLFMRASSDQRAKAFLLTLNLWTNS